MAAVWHICGLTAYVDTNLGFTLFTFLLYNDCKWCCRRKIYCCAFLELIFNLHSPLGIPTWGKQHAHKIKTSLCVTLLNIKWNFYELKST